MSSGSNEQLHQQLEYTLLKSDCHSWWISKMQSGREVTLEERYAIKLCFKLGKNATETTYGILQTAFGKACTNRASVFEWYKRFKEGSVSVRDDERCGRSKEVNTPELIDQRVRVRVTMLRFWGISGRDSLERGQYSSNRVSGISNRTMHQSTTPSLSLTIWPRRASRQFFSLPIGQTLLPVIFGYFLSSEVVVLRQLRRWKAVTKVIDTLTQEDFHGPSRSCWNSTTSVLQPKEITSRRLEFHVFTINKIAHTKKVWKLI